MHGDDRCPAVHFRSTNLIRLATLLMKKGDQVLQAKLGLTFAQLHVLIMVQCFSPVSQSQLAEHLHLTQAAVSRIAELMVKKGLLNRETNANNRRINLLTITPKGEDLILQAQTLVRRLEDRLYRHVTAAKFDVWSAVTTQLLSVLVSGSGKEFRKSESDRT